MFRYLISISLFTLVLANADIDEDQGYSFTITEADYSFATYYEIDSSDTYDGQVKKSRFRMRTNYDLSDRHGWQATGVRRLFSLGVFKEWAAEIDVYDTRGIRIGLIDGEVFSTEHAKFKIYSYDDEGNYSCKGIAYLDRQKGGFTIYDPIDAMQHIAMLKRVFVAGARDYWQVKVVQGNEIDERIIRIFATFALDTQSAFNLDDVDEEPIDIDSLLDSVEY